MSVACCCYRRDNIDMRIRSRYIFLLTTAILLLVILTSDILTNKPDTGVGSKSRPVSLERAANPDNAGPVPVLVVSYMRSGSSFTSDVITTYPSTFYIFEPLKFSISKSSIELVNGSTVSTSGKWPSLAAEFIQGWLTCKFDRLDKDALISITKTPSTSRFKLCLSRDKSNKNEAVFQSCLKAFQKQCEASKLRLVKTIRVQMRTTVEILLKNVPGLKVIHLFRDQRPRLLSAEKIHIMMSLSLQQTAQLECSAAADDVDMYKVMRQEHPGQLGTLLYETLAEDPIGTAGRLFAFLHLPFTNISVKRIMKMTSSSTEFRCDFCTTKKNSTKTAHAWRTQHDSDLEKIKLIEKECEKIQRVLGYVPIKNIKQLRDLSVDLRIKTLFNANMI